VDEVVEFASTDVAIQSDFDKLEYQYAVLVDFIKLAFPETLEKNTALKNVISGSEQLYSGKELHSILTRRETFNINFMEHNEPNHPNIRFTGFRNDVARSMLAQNHKHYYSPFHRLEKLKKIIDETFAENPHPEINPSLEATLENLKIFRNGYL
jgi:hypothetical protein